MSDIDFRVMFFEYRKKNYFLCRKKKIFVVVYRSKDKNTTQGNLVELVGSPVAPLRCK